MTTQPSAAPRSSVPRASLSVMDGALMMVGIIIGIGIFKAPQLVALNVASEAAFVGAWVAGGLATLIGAWVYAELATTYPSTGGEYHFLRQAFGLSPAFLFAWARATVIQTGAIAAVAFVFGDYAQQLYGLGPYGSAIYGGAMLLVLTAVNLAGTYESKTAQNVLTFFEVAAMAAIAVIGFLVAAPTGAPAAPSAGGGGAIGLAMVFVLLTYGGWNEAAYLSADLRDNRRDMLRILLAGTAVVTTLYVLINLAYLHALGLDGLRRSNAVAADVMRIGLGEAGAVLLSVFVCCAALSTVNASIFTGARLYHALGQDLALERLGIWDTAHNNPRNAIIVQSLIAAALIAFGAIARDGFQAMVEYTAPVFWFFLLMVGVGFFRLRRRDPDRERPVRVPLYPVVPLVFCLICAYLLYSSLAYTGRGALVGLVVVALGIPVLMALRRHRAVSPG